MDIASTVPCQMGSARKLEQVVRLATSAHVFFSTLHQMLGGRQFSPSDSSPVANPVAVSPKIKARYFQVAQALNHTMSVQKAMFLEVNYAV